MGECIIDRSIVVLFFAIRLTFPKSKSKILSTTHTAYGDHGQNGQTSEHYCVP